MPANVKSADAMTKHLTKAEKSAREAAEKSCLPDRMKAMKMPRSLSGDKTAQGYWRSILKRMEGQPFGAVPWADRPGGRGA